MQPVISVPRSSLPFEHLPDGSLSRYDPDSGLYTFYQPKDSGLSEAPAGRTTDISGERDGLRLDERDVRTPAAGRRRGRELALEADSPKRHVGDGLLDFADDRPTDALDQDASRIVKRAKTMASVHLPERASWTDDPLHPDASDERALPGHARWGLGSSSNQVADTPAQGAATGQSEHCGSGPVSSSFMRPTHVSNALSLSLSSHPLGLSLQSPSMLPSAHSSSSSSLSSSSSSSSYLPASSSSASSLASAFMPFQAKAPTNENARLLARSNGREAAALCTLNALNGKPGGSGAAANGGAPHAPAASLKSDVVLASRRARAEVDFDQRVAWLKRTESGAKEYELAADPERGACGVRNYRKWAAQPGRLAAKLHSREASPREFEAAIQAYLGGTSTKDSAKIELVYYLFLRSKNVFNMSSHFVGWKVTGAHYADRLDAGKMLNYMAVCKPAESLDFRANERLAGMAGFLAGCRAGMNQEQRLVAKERILAVLRAGDDVRHAGAANLVATFFDPKSGAIKHLPSQVITELFAAPGYLDKVIAAEWQFAAQTQKVELSAKQHEALNAALLG